MVQNLKKFLLLFHPIIQSLILRLFKNLRYIVENTKIFHFIPKKFILFVHANLKNLLFKSTYKSDNFYAYNILDCPSSQGDKVSIILPTYNQSNYLEIALLSILNQTHQNLEVIVINDGSTDDTSSILEKYHAHKNIKIYQQENAGLPNALNNGLLLSQGDFITWTSSDNILLPNAIARLVECIKENPAASLIYGDYEAIDQTGLGIGFNLKWRLHNRAQSHPSHVILPKDGKLRKRMPDNFIGPYFMFSRNTYEKVGLHSRIMGIEDYDYWLRCERIGPIVHMKNSEMFYQYRIHDNTLSNSFREYKIIENVKVLTQLQDIIDERNLKMNDLKELTEKQCHGLLAQSHLPKRVGDLKKVLILIDNWGIGGLEKIVLSQLSYFTKIGCEARILISNHVNQLLPPEVLPYALFLKNERNLREKLLNWRPQIGIAHYAFENLAILDDLGIPHIQVIHNTYVWLSNGEVDVIRKKVKNVVKFVCVSNQVAEYAADRLKLPMSKILVIPNGIDLDVYGDLRQKKLQISTPKFLCAATYTEHKRQYSILQSFTEVVTKFPQSSLTFVGHVASKSYYDFLENRIRELGLEKNVSLRNFEPDLSNFYLSHNIAISASLYEGWSLSLSEAAVSGMALVATDVGSTRELSRYTKVFKVPNEPKSFKDLNPLNLLKYANNPPPNFITELAAQMINACEFILSADYETEFRLTYLEELNSDLSNLRYFDTCQEVHNENY